MRHCPVRQQKICFEQKSFVLEKIEALIASLNLLVQYVYCLNISHFE
uniref:Uncharacterized protein n=1 Tax=Anguilla anguilla TaxID=7936 RepID=A0A0E9RFM2_ANGAN